MDFYKDIFADLSLLVDNNSKLMDDNNYPSFIALMAYANYKDMDLDEWIIDYFETHNSYLSDQKKNYAFMKRDVNKYFNMNNR